MDDPFPISDRSRALQAELADFLDTRVLPAEARYAEQMRKAGDPHHHPAVLEELKTEARSRGLWNLFHPHPGDGVPGLSNLDYAPLCELMGHSPHLAPEACNCAAPDTGNMEILESFGTAEHRRQWLHPLLNGEIRSAFAMTEPDVASSDASNIALTMTPGPGGYRLDGRKWFASNALHPRCAVLIVMGVTDPHAHPHRRHSMAVVPVDAAGVTIQRNLPVFGYHDREGHAVIEFDGVRVPAEDILSGPGEGFAIGQARLGPGRIHHCMRAIGMAERALESMCRRADTRVVFGNRLADQANIQDWIAESRIAIEQARLLTYRAAHLMDTIGNRAAATEIAAIKVAVPAAALAVIDRAIQVHGAGGVTDDFPLAAFWAHVRALRIADGPDEVHKRTIARRELRKHREAADARD
ncbi:acyl-CoA dehydrogenase family protein [Prauserella flavalba]|uniref:acyl-CoA dehydrogenase family protein n=1 Tax=Prauserella flavalba TaxID=1477506 RepID=UPI0036E9E99C